MSKKQSTLDSFLKDFSAESDGSGLRPEWKPDRDEVHKCEIVDFATVSNEFGESTMIICIVGGEEKVWFLKGNENRDFDAFRQTNTFRFRLSSQGHKNSPLRTQIVK